MCRVSSSLLLAQQQQQGGGRRRRGARRRVPGAAHAAQHKQSVARDHFGGGAADGTHKTLGTPAAVGNHFGTRHVFQTLLTEGGDHLLVHAAHALARLAADAVVQMLQSVQRPAETRILFHQLHPQKRNNKEKQQKNTRERAKQLPCNQPPNKTISRFIHEWKIV